MVRISTLSILIAAGCLAASTLPPAALASPLLWAVDAPIRIDPDDAREHANRIWSSTRGEVLLRAARGESEGFHLVVTSEGGGATGLEVVGTTLVSGSAAIAIDRIHFYREAFFDVATISDVEGHPRIGQTGSFADALIPFVDPYGSGQEIGVPFAVAAGKSQPLWVLVDVPRNAIPGLYHGEISLRRQSDGQVHDQVRLVLEVLSVTLPERPVFQALYNLDPELVSELHGDDASPQLLRNALEELASRRIAPGYEYPAIPAYDNDTGFSWEGAEAEWRHWLDEREVSVVNLPSLWDDLNGRYRIQQGNGQPYVSANLTPGSHFDQQARLFYKRLWQALSDRSWIDRAVIYFEADDLGEISDEPYAVGSASYDRIRAWADIFHHPDASDPSKRFRFLVAGDSLIPSAPYADLRDHIDIWDHYMDEIDDRRDLYLERLSDHPEEELWLVPNSYGDFIDYPAVHPRSLGHFAWKTGATGLEHWDSIAWYDAQEEPVNPWNPSNLTPVWGWGGGAELWPGHDIEGRGLSILGPLPSLRLELNRQAFEDYDLLHLLADRGDSGLADALAQAAVPSRLWEGLEVDRDQFGRSHGLALALLEQDSISRTVITGEVEDTSGSPLAGALLGNGSYAALSESDGSYRLVVPAGPTTLNASLDGYLTKSVSLLAPGSTASADFQLERLAVAEVSLFGSFESEDQLWEGEGVQIQLSSEHVSEGSRSQRVVFLSSSSEAVINPADSIDPSDWSSRDAFVMDVFNGSSWLTELDVEIFDSQDRETIELFYLTPDEWTQVRIPVAGMRSDSGDVAWLEIYADSAGKGDRTLYFDHFRLETTTGSDDKAPGAPSALTAQSKADPALDGVGRPAVEITWSAPISDAGGGALSGVQRYEVLRGPAGTAPSVLLNSYEVVTSPAFRDLEVRDGESWSYAVRAVDAAGNRGPLSGSASVSLGGDPEPCASDDTTLCLNNDRFEVRVTFETAEISGSATTVELTEDTGYFWFFQSTNIEIVLKVLDACGVNDRYWVFVAGLTDQAVQITVRDTNSGATRSYSSAMGTAFSPIQDTVAFATCP